MPATRIHPPDVYVADTGTRKGRGVFAARAFRAGEVVETSPVIVMPNPKSLVGPPPQIKVDFRRGMKVLLFNWSGLAKASGRALALGYGSLYNSANPANLRYEAVPDLPALRFIAHRDIAADEELTINYSAAGGGVESPDYHWFTEMEIEPIP